MNPPEQSSFTELLARARSGDRGAWEEVFSRLGREDAEGATLLAMARRLLAHGDPVRNFVDSSDLMQSALRCGWLDLDDFRGETPAEFLAWIRSILRFRLNRVLRRKRPRSGLDTSAQQDSERREESPLTVIVRDEVRQRLLRAVETLPEDQRDVMKLRLQGLKAPDIAAMLDLKPAAVRKRESRAVERLRAQLNPEGRRE